MPLTRQSARRLTSARFNPLMAEKQTKTSKPSKKAKKSVEVKVANENVDRDLTENEVETNSAKCIFEFTVKDIDNNPVSLEKYRGFVALIVNVASRCGYTKSNYEGLNALYDKYENDGLRILAFPCNQFGGQEPKSEVDIKEFMKKRDVRFDAFSKIEVNGKNAHPLYDFLKSKQTMSGVEAIKWNFVKFLVNKEGIPVQRFASKFDAKKLDEEIKKLL